MCVWMFSLTEGKVPDWWMLNADLSPSKKLINSHLSLLHIRLSKAKPPNTGLFVRGSQTSTLGLVPTLSLCSPLQSFLKSASRLHLLRKFSGFRCFLCSGLFMSLLWFIKAALVNIYIHRGFNNCNFIPDFLSLIHSSVLWFFVINDQGDFKGYLDTEIAFAELFIIFCRYICTYIN